MAMPVNEQDDLQFHTCIGCTNYMFLHEFYYTVTEKSIHRM